MRLQRVSDAQIPADLAAWYVGIYNHVGLGKYQALAYKAPHEFARLNQTLDVLRALDGRRTCLEVGCSEGIVTKELAQLFEHVTAIDINPNALTVCPQLPNVEYKQADIENDELTDTFDVVLLSDVLEHLRSPQGAVMKCAARARWVVGVGPTSEPLNEQNAFNPERLTHASRPGDGTGHIWYLDREGMLSWFDGLKVERVEPGGEHHTVILARGLLVSPEAKQ